MDPLAHLIQIATPFGLCGLLAAALFERLLPIVPSYALLVAVGIGSEGGAWSLPLAWIATTLGGLVGCVLLYALAGSLGEERLRQGARWCGVSPTQVDALALQFRTRLGLVAFGTQLVPGVRLVVPGVAGLLGASRRGFLAASTAGIAIWNGLFLAVGYIASRLIEHINASELALHALVALLLIEGLAWFLWRRSRATRASRALPR